MKWFCLWSHDIRYHRLACACAASFANFGVEVRVEELPTSYDWMKNCMRRASALKLRAEIHPDEVIVLLDSDLTCVADPVVLKRFTGEHWDISVHDKGPTASKNVRYCPGIIAFAPTVAGRACLQHWAQLCETDPEPHEMLREQVYLHTAIESAKKRGLRVHTLDNEYNTVAPVICHHVASRKLRDEIRHPPEILS